MYRNSVFRTDPFFTQDPHMKEEIEGMDRWMHNFQPFEMSRALQVPFEQNEINFGQPRSRMLVRPRVTFEDEHFKNMENFWIDAQKSAPSPPEVHSYRSSKVYSYTNDGVNEPKHFEAISETTQGPGGVKQTLNRERNSVTGKDRMQAGRFISSRGHVVEKSEDMRSRAVDINHEYLHMDANDSEDFHQEWRKKAGPMFRRKTWSELDGTKLLE